MKKAPPLKDDNISIKISSADKQRINDHLDVLNANMPLGIITRSEWIWSLITAELSKKTKGDVREH